MQQQVPSSPWLDPGMLWSMVDAFTPGPLGHPEDIIFYNLLASQNHLRNPAENHYVQIKYIISQAYWQSYLREVPCSWPVLWFSLNPHRHQCLQAAEVVQGRNSSGRQCHGPTEGSRGRRGIEGWMGGKKQEARVISQIMKALALALPRSN